MAVHANQSAITSSANLFDIASSLVAQTLRRAATHRCPCAKRTLSQDPAKTLVQCQVSCARNYSARPSSVRRGQRSAPSVTRPPFCEIMPTVKVCAIRSNAVQVGLYQLLAYCTVLGIQEGHLMYAKGNAEELSQLVVKSAVGSAVIP